MDLRGFPDADAGEDPSVVSWGADGATRPMSRQLAHQPPGVLHQAVSVQLCASGRWLLQRRADLKPLFAGCWSNSCCTHPLPGEAPAQAARRRVGQELGLVVADLVEAGAFTYRAQDPESGLVEYEHDHVFVAVCDVDAAVADPHEIGELAALSFEQALARVRSEAGTPWASEVLQRARRALDA